MDFSPPVLTYHWVVTGIALVVVKLAVDKALSVQKAFATIRDCPGRTMLWFNPLSALSLGLSTTFPRPGMSGCWAAKFSPYENLGTTALASVLPSGARIFFWLADSDAIKLVSSDRHTFQKDVVDYEIINIYGKNVVSTEGSDWKRHRSVSMSAFNEANIALVLSETLHVMAEWFEQLDAVDSDVAVDLVQSMTRATLLVIAAAGFGRRMPWSTDTATELPPGCKLPFHSAVVDSVDNVIFRALIPKWFYGFSSFVKIPYLSSRVLSSQLAFDDLRSHMLDLVASAHVDIISDEHHDTSGAALLRNLVEANMNQGGNSKKLTEGELLSNIFAFLLAGHETSSHTLCFVFLLLALHPECQQKLYDEVTRVWPIDVPVTQLTASHKEFDKLEYTVACIRETLRTFPSEPRLTKNVHSDTALPYTRFVPGSKQGSVKTEKLSMAIPAGSTILMDVWAVHMNTLYWGEDAAEFNPERFLDTESYQWPRHAFLPFSVGARSCIGQRFAYTEMVAILASVVRRYRIQVPDGLAKRPWEEQKEVLLKWKMGLTLTPMNARVKFCRRT